MSKFGFVIMVLGFCLMAVGIVFLILSFIEGSTIEETECYDRYRSEIKGLTCEREVIPYEIIILLFFCGGALIVFFGAISYED